MYFVLDTAGYAKPTHETPEEGHLDAEVDLVWPALCDAADTTVDFLLGRTRIILLNAFFFFLKQAT